MRRTMVVLIWTMMILSACGSEGSGALEVEATGLPGTTTPAVTIPVPDGAGLADRGPFGVGRFDWSITDPARRDRVVSGSTFFPGVTENQLPDRHAEVDDSAAPYPVVLGSVKIGDTVGPHLASHGFVFVAVDLPVAGPSYWPNAEILIDMPLDQMAALDYLENPDHPLHGLADTSRSGVIGYSFGSNLALAASGARVDPAYYEATCAARPEGWTDNWWGYVCGSAGWSEAVARAGELGLAEPDGRWRRLGDERILAVMPMGPEGFEVFGPAGLAEATAAALLIAAGSDTINDYEPATTGLFEHYPGAELITFVGADHSMIFETDVIAQIRRFSLAFFGLHLRQQLGFSEYLTREFIEDIAPGLGDAGAFETLLWGVLPGV